MTQTPPIESSRVRAVKSELDKCAIEYHAAKEQFEKARIEFEIAREKLTGVRQLAATMLTPDDWFNWRYDHPDVMYAGTPVGDAIMWVLWSHAWNSAYAIVNRGADTPYSPEMSQQQIMESLERGGFDFRTTTPLREINGALMQLKGVTKLENGDYKKDDAVEIFEEVQQKYGKKGKEE